MSETTAPLLATRDALARAIHRTHEGGCDFPPQPGLCIEAGRQADALLASGVVRDPATLAADKALVERVTRRHWGIAQGEWLTESERLNTGDFLRALAAALTEDPS